MCVMEHTQVRLDGTEGIVDIESKRNELHVIQKNQENHRNDRIFLSRYRHLGEHIEQSTFTYIGETHDTNL